MSNNEIKLTVRVDSTKARSSARKFARELDALDKAVNKEQRSLIDLVKVVGIASNELDNLGRSTTLLTGNMDVAMRNVKRVSDGYNNMGTAMSGANVQLKNTASATADLSPTLNSLTGNLKSAVVAEKAFSATTTGLLGTITRAREETRQLGTVIAGDVVGAFRAGMSATRTYSAATTGLAATVRTAREETRQLGLVLAGDVVGNFKNAAAATNKVANGYSSLNTKAKGASASMKQVGNATAGVSAAMASLSGKTTTVTAKTSGLRAALRQTASQYRIFGTAMRNVTVMQALMVGGMVKVVDKLFALGRGLVTFAKFSVNVSSDMLGFRNALQVASGSLDTANERMSTAIDISRMLKLDVLTLTKEYSKFINATTLAGMSFQDAEKHFKQFATTARVLNLSTQATQGMFLALEQMVSKGTVSMEELRRQLGQHIPGAMQIAARAMGYGEGEMRKFFKAVENGEVSSRELIAKMGDELGGKTLPLLEQALKKPSAALTLMRSEFTLLAEAIGARIGPAVSSVANKLSAFLRWLTDSVKPMESLNSTTTELAESYDKLAGATDTVKVALKTITEPTGDLNAKGLLLLGTIGAGGTAGLIHAFKLLLKGLKWLFGPFITIGQYLAKTTIGAKVLASGMALLKGSFLRFAGVAGVVAGAIFLLTKRWWEFRKATQEHLAANEQFETLRKKAELLGLTLFETKERINDLVINAGATSQETVTRMFVGMSLALQELNKAAGEARARIVSFKAAQEGMDPASDAYKRLAQNIRIVEADLAKINMTQLERARIVNTLREGVIALAGAEQLVGEKAAESAPAMQKLISALQKQLVKLDSGNSVVAKYIELARQKGLLDDVAYAQMIKLAGAVDAKTAAEKRANEAQREAKRLADEAQRAQEAIQSAYKSGIESLREQEIALMDGARAAKLFSLTLQGFDAAEIASTMKIWDNIEAIKEQTKAKKDADKLKIQTAKDTLALDQLALNLEELEIQDSLKKGELDRWTASAMHNDILRKRITMLQKSRAVFAELGNVVKAAQIDVKIKEMELAMIDLNQEIRDLTEDSFATFFEDIMNGTKSVEDAIKDMAMSIVREINSLVAKQLGKQLAQSLFPEMTGGSSGGGGLGNILGNVVGSLLGPSVGSAFNPAVSGAGIKFTPSMALGPGHSFAAGGFPPTNEVSLVGENGPELIVPRKPTQVIPNEKLNLNSKAMTQNVTNVNNTFNIQAPNGNISKKSISQLQAAAGVGLQRSMGKNK